MHLAAFLGLAVSLCTTAATAQGAWPPGLGAQGRFMAGYTDRVPGADAFLFGDATLRLELKRLPLGVELGVYGLANALDTPHETYGALTWDLAQGGRIFLGVPRPAFDSFAVSALEQDFPELGIARTGATRSLATFGAMYGNFLPYGARFEHSAGALRYAASVHHAPNVDRTIAGLGLEYPLADWTLSGAVEVAWGQGTEVSGKVQARGDLGPVTAGLGYYSPGAVGGPDLLEAFAFWRPWDRLRLSGIIQVPVDGSADATAGLAGRYALRPGLDL